MDCHFEIIWTLLRVLHVPFCRIWPIGIGNDIGFNDWCLGLQSLWIANTLNSSFFVIFWLSQTYVRLLSVRWIHAIGRYSQKNHRWLFHSHCTQYLYSRRDDWWVGILHVTEEEGQQKTFDRHWPYKISFHFLPQHVICFNTKFITSWERECSGTCKHNRCIIDGVFGHTRRCWRRYMLRCRKYIIRYSGWGVVKHGSLIDGASWELTPSWLLEASSLL